ncbi:hypothetical protein BJF79_31665 [Actinomadura sp. CNU-125]|nr:hypothetical protein BJF79_31665 [Actinomadura sp. CNU-125]
MRRASSGGWRASSSRPGAAGSSRRPRRSRLGLLAGRRLARCGLVARFRTGGRLLGHRPRRPRPRRVVGGLVGGLGGGLVRGLGGLFGGGGLALLRLVGVRGHGGVRLVAVRFGRGVGFGGGFLDGLVVGGLDRRPVVGLLGLGDGVRTVFRGLLVGLVRGLVGGLVGGRGLRRGLVRTLLRGLRLRGLGGGHRLVLRLLGTGGPRLRGGRLLFELFEGRFGCAPPRGLDRRRVPSGVVEGADRLAVGAELARPSGLLPGRERGARVDDAAALHDVLARLGGAQRRLGGAFERRLRLGGQPAAEIARADLATDLAADLATHVAAVGDDLHRGAAGDQRGDGVGELVVVPVDGGEPGGDLVQRRDVPAARVERPFGGVRAAVVEEGQADAPGAVVALPGVPLDVFEVDAAAAEAFLDGLAEGRAGRGLAGPPDGDALRLLGHVFAFLQDRTLEPADPLDRDAGGLGDLLRGLTRPDACLDLLGTQGTLHFDLELAEAGEVPTDRCADAVVDGQGEPGASARGGQDEVCSVLADRDEAQLLHACPSCPVLTARRAPNRSVGAECVSAAPAPFGRPLPAEGACVPFPRVPESLFRTHLLPAPYPACPNIAALEAPSTSWKRAPDQACRCPGPAGDALSES